MDVANNPNRINDKAARNFPNTNSKLFIGKVEMISIVPRLCSRAMRPIDTAGIKNK